jgi:MFS family permease
MAYVTGAVAPAQRGRVLSTFGGVNRAGTFAGPVIGGLVAEWQGLASPFFVAGIVSLLAAYMATRGMAEVDAAKPSPGRQIRWHMVGALAVRHRQELATAGSAQVFAQVIRAGRQLIVPLYASSTLGLGVGVIGVIGSISAAIDMLMFLPAGLVMDRVGRKFASVPSFLLLSAGMALIPFTNSAATLIAVTALMGFGNGIGSGSMMTLGTDLAPRESLGEFLGLWRLMGDTGSSAGPMIVGEVALLVGLNAAAIVLAGVGVLSALTLVFFVQETLHLHQRQVAAAPEAPKPAT